MTTATDRFAKRIFTRIAAALFTVVIFVTRVCAAELQSSPEFPDELVHFEPLSTNIVFSGTGTDTWDQKIRERSWIVRDGDSWRMWYNGYNPSRTPTHFLGYATSDDGLLWKRSGDESIYDKGWIEDICIVKDAGTFYMFSEGRDDIAHLLKSKNGKHWEAQGNLDVRNVDGTPIKPGPYGTPTVFVENGVWNLFYERDDAAVWLARSKDLKIWTNVQDEPVLKRGPEEYDKFAVACNQVIKHQGRYYAYYHASAKEKWTEWSTCLAVSSDLQHWKKFSGNPILPVNPDDPKRSSAFLVYDGKRFRLYAAHPNVKVFVSRKQEIPPNKTHN
jgi:hypothetical protein